MDRNKRVGLAINYVGLIVMGLFSLGYCMFDRRFAELHLKFSFLNFPIFVGEILIFLCLVLLVIKMMIKGEEFYVNLRPFKTFLKKRWLYVLFSVYFGFILTKAMWGYFKWGPLAFRHAALFYYPLFALFGYTFYTRRFFDSKRSLFIVLLIISVFMFRFIPFYDYFLLTWFILAFVLIRVYPYKIVRYILFFLLFIFSPYRDFFQTSRTMLVSNVVTGIYVAAGLFFILKIKEHYKMIISLTLVIFMVVGILTLADTNAVKSLVGFKELVRLYRSYDKFIKKEEGHFKMKSIQEVKLYNPEVKPIEGIQSSIKKVKLKIEELESKINKAERRLAKTQLTTDLVSPQRSLRSLEGVYHNFLFRIFIWRDMLRELAHKKPLLGFDFGKPFRSKSLEILHWADIDWLRDGWITTHNSFLEVVYRAGLAGILFIIILFTMLFKMIKKSIVLKSTTGILLCGILINWLTAANSLVILELPYNAIPFWSLFGITLAYLNSQESSKVL